MIPTTFLILTLLHAVIAADWNYIDTNKWGGMCSTGQHQSPIEIDTAQVEEDATLDRIVYNNYAGKYAGVIANNGRTFIFNINAEQQPKDSTSNNTSSTYDILNGMPSISGGQLPANDNFVFSQINFHWGATPKTGAEHTIVNQSVAPMEVHLVHYNRKYANLINAINYPDGVAVIGFLFDQFSFKNDGKNPTDTDYKQFKEYVPKVISQKTSTEATIDFSKLIPKSALDGTGIFYRYNGSLTAPPCSEVVTWTLYSARIPLENSVLEELIKLKFKKWDTGKEVSLYDNYRLVKPLNGRRVLQNRPASTPVSRISATATSTDDASTKNHANNANRICIYLIFTMLAAAAFFNRV